MLLISAADAGARILEFYTCRGEQFEDNNIQWRLSPVSKISFFTITTENFECRVPCSCCHPIPKVAAAAAMAGYDMSFVLVAYVS